jgi:hypothetical protein
LELERFEVDFLAAAFFGRALALAFLPAARFVLLAFGFLAAAFLALAFGFATLAFLLVLPAAFFSAISACLQGKFGVRVRVRLCQFRSEGGSASANRACTGA